MHHWGIGRCSTDDEWFQPSIVPLLPDSLDTQSNSDTPSFVRLNSTNRTNSHNSCIDSHSPSSHNERYLQINRYLGKKHKPLSFTFAVLSQDLFTEQSHKNQLYCCVQSCNGKCTAILLASASMPLIPEFAENPTTRILSFLLRNPNERKS